MDDSAGEAGGQIQGHGCSSYPLSFPSQPPDIKNWFSSYEYESPEVPELVADPAVENGSETQDPFEHPLSKHSFRDGGIALRENCLGEQSLPEVFAGKYLVPVDKSATKPATKRKQSLRTLFGEGFLDKDEEAAETEGQRLLPVQRNALEPPSDCVASLPDTNQSQEWSAEHSNLLVDCDGISSVDTQESTPADQEVECSKQSVDYDDASLSNIDVGEGFAEDVIHQIEQPLNSNGANLVATEKNNQDGVEHTLRPASHNNFNLADTQENSPLEGTRHCKIALCSKRPQETVASDGFIAVKRKEKRPEECRVNEIPRHPMGREKENGKLQENNGISEQKVLDQEQTRHPLADRTNFLEVAAAAPAQEVSRKWKCPRKGKPFVGRPLKQLRLEQWVRQMN
ncbi:hypothetical protein SETIT_7G217600v2 [Setaria italica]|uniref:Uncharacterized protein n=1 Tax=Setaria italica TaxID=4555 RepID=A0A368RYD4_SETIT|nr:uncharacterized protein LOC101785315 [Setaria italica]RCV35158.1 hypothetical protein SETIT_7G217600v2 [Setaria italica]